jgi:hypothetical protein
MPSCVMNWLTRIRLWTAGRASSTPMIVSGQRSVVVRPMSSSLVARRSSKSDSHHHVAMSTELVAASRPSATALQACWPSIISSMRFPGLAGGPTAENHLCRSPR